VYTLAAVHSFGTVLNGSSDKYHTVATCILCMMNLKFRSRDPLQTNLDARALGMLADFD
jgi:hypothetical protein